MLLLKNAQDPGTASEIAEDTGLPLDSMYMRLRRLRRIGLVQVESSLKGDGPGRPAQVYSTTKKGRETLTMYTKRLESLLIQLKK